MPSNNRMPLLLCLIVAGVVAFTGCDKGSREAAQPAASSAADDQPSADELSDVRELVQKEATERRSAAPGAMDGIPAGHPPIDQQTTRQRPPRPAEATGIKYVAPESWTKETPASSMRADQYSLPRAEGDEEDGELAIFKFAAGSGGAIDANISRWRKQFSTADGQPLPDDKALPTKTEVNGLEVTLIDIDGRYQATSMMFGGAPPAAKDNYRMLGALVDTPVGLWVFKAVGPAATMAKHEESFSQFVQSVETE